MRETLTREIFQLLNLSRSELNLYILRAEVLITVQVSVPDRLF